MLLHVHTWRSIYLKYSYGHHHPHFKVWFGLFSPLCWDTGTLQASIMEPIIVLNETICGFKLWNTYYDNNPNFNQILGTRTTKNTISLVDVSNNRGIWPAKWMVKIMVPKPYEQMDDWGVVFLPIFGWKHPGCFWWISVSFHPFQIIELQTVEFKAPRCLSMHMTSRCRWKRCIYLEPQTTISYLKIWNHPIETPLISGCLGFQVYIHTPKKEAGGARLIPKRHSWPDYKLYIYMGHMGNLWTSSILGFQPSKRRPKLQSKQGVIWVPGIYRCHKCVGWFLNAQHTKHLYIRNLKRMCRVKYVNICKWYDMYILIVN